ncbi:MAG TPA: YbdK family carboxylate-amine ligase [Solirubrobacteraceae bacterium]|nr:YbdK family carboxylate-amine ligase [Solirubrobacteraceae bacterium]
MELDAITRPREAEERLAHWADWHASRPYTVGIEEEIMLLDPSDWGLAHAGEHVLAGLAPALSAHAAAETHQATLELATSPYERVEDTAREAAELRGALAAALSEHGLCGGSAGTHPLALWSDTRVSRSARYQLVYETMRELARREPTFALHVHVGVADPESALALQNRLRTHVPLLLALAANSPFWQARDTGLASARTPIFQAFPRVGVPRVFHSYAHYVEVVDQLLRVHAFPAPTFLWWDVRLQPSLGTVELRVMDAQISAADTAALAALVQTIAHLELEEGYASERSLRAEEVIHENRFLAARDGMNARFIDPVAEVRISAREALDDLLHAARGHAEQLGCEEVLEPLHGLALENGALRQLRFARRHGLPGLVEALAERFAEPLPFG